MVRWPEDEWGSPVTVASYEGGVTVRGRGAMFDPQSSEDTWRSILLSHDVQGALGKEVRSGTGENLGRIVDVLVDQDGQVRAAVIDFGGFLGVGRRKIVVDWRALHFARLPISQIASASI